ncbi:Nucleotidyltransferase domain protein, BT0168 group [Olavius sp. associated proteobacterium Delta 1]|nr:Nucleotidyltransferase domain protein, BT0168 group [Olavius sp. associated proteobacterium Delta 1]
MGKAKLNLPEKKITDFCKKNYIIKLSLFGSVLREDFRIDSDLDFLVEFKPGKVPGLIKLCRMQRELSEILNGRKVDLRTPQELSKYFRDEVLTQAEVQYASG